MSELEAESPGAHRCPERVDFQCGLRERVLGTVISHLRDDDGVDLHIPVYVHIHNCPFHFQNISNIHLILSC